MDRVCVILKREYQIPIIERRSNMKVFKIGQILTSTKDIVLEHALSGEEVTIPKGSKVIIGADKLAHHMQDGMVQSFKEEIEVSGYDSAGLAEYLYLCLQKRFPLDEMLENYDCTKDEFVETIESCLDDIGMVW